MRKIILAAVGLAAIASGVQAADRQRMDDLATCLAFSFVKNGLDGVKDVPADLIPGILVIKDEFLFEASVNGLDDNAAQTLVVERLQEQNKIKEISGLNEVVSRYLPLCRSVGESLSRPQ
jgi:hypothetical protein